MPEATPRRRVAVERAHDELAVVALEEAAAAIGDGRAFRGADAEHAHGQAVALGRGAGAGETGRFGAVGDQQHVAGAAAALAYQLAREIDRRGRLAALAWHDRGVEVLQLAGQGLGVVGQRGDDEGLGGEHHQRGLAVVAFAQQVG